jgi:hypothetical protein
MRARLVEVLAAVKGGLVIQVAAGRRVSLACLPVDLRKGFYGLAAQVATVLQDDP